MGHIWARGWTPWYNHDRKELLNTVVLNLWPAEPCLVACGSPHRSRHLSVRKQGTSLLPNCQTSGEPSGLGNMALFQHMGLGWCTAESVHALSGHSANWPHATHLAHRIRKLGTTSSEEWGIIWQMATVVGLKEYFHLLSFPHQALY